MGRRCGEFLTLSFNLGSHLMLSFGIASSCLPASLVYLLLSLSESRNASSFFPSPWELNLLLFYNGDSLSPPLLLII